MKKPDQVEKELRDLGWWYQHFQLPSGVWTGQGQEPAYKPATRWNFIEPYVPKDLTGQTVLDVGGNAGFFSIQMKLRGAARCVLVEPFPEFVRQAEYASGEFGVELEIVNQDVHVYCLSTEERFDYVLFLGLFYHLKYPGLVLDRLAEMTKRRMFFQSHLVGDESSAYHDKPNYARDADDSVIEDPAFPRLAFIEKLYNADSTNWWIPNFTVLEPMLRSAGMRVVARPHPQCLIAEPFEYFGKTVFPKMVFPRYGKQGSPLPWEPPRADAGLHELPAEFDFAGRAPDLPSGVATLTYDDSLSRIVVLEQLSPELGLRHRSVTRQNIQYLRPTGDLPLPSGSVDVVVANHVFEQADHPRELAAEISRVLKSDGLLLATAPRANGFPQRLYRWWTGVSDHPERYTFAAFQEMVESAGDMILLYANRLYSSFSFLNPDPTSAHRPGSRAQTFQYLPPLLHLASLTGLNVAARGADALLGVQAASLYGWAFYFGKPGAVLTKVPREELINVCAFCGYAHSSGILEHSRKISNRFGIPTFVCTVCKCRNPYFGRAWNAHIRGRQWLEEEAAAPSVPSASSQPPAPRTEAVPTAPCIDSITDAFQFSPRLAPGTIIQVTGQNLASASDRAPENQWPLDLAGTQLLVNGLPTPLSSVSPGKLVGLLPLTLPRGSASIVVNCRGVSSAPREVFLSLTAPSLATANALGQGEAGLFFHNANWKPVTSTDPAREAEVVACYATGLGPVVPLVSAGQPGSSAPPSETLRRGTVTISNRPARVEYCGLAAGLVGLYQVNIRIPAGIPEGLLPVVLKIGGRCSNAVNIAIAR